MAFWGIGLGPERRTLPVASAAELLNAAKPENRQQEAAGTDLAHAGCRQCRETEPLGLSNGESPPFPSQSAPSSEMHIMTHSRGSKAWVPAPGIPA
jgi:hypothetical protein